MLGAPNEVAPPQQNWSWFPRAQPFRECRSFLGLDELVGIQRRHPVGAKLIDCHVHKSCHMSALLVAHRALTQYHEREALFTQSAKHFIGAIAAGIVDNYDLVEVSDMMPNECFDDVGLVLYPANADQLHAVRSFCCRPC